MNFTRKKQACISVAIVASITSVAVGIVGIVASMSIAVPSFIKNLSSSKQIKEQTKILRDMQKRKQTR